MVADLTAMDLASVAARRGTAAEAMTMLHRLNLRAAMVSSSTPTATRR
jgi:hypothetical protein